MMPHQGRCHTVVIDFDGFCPWLLLHRTDAANVVQIFENEATIDIRKKI